MGLRFECDSPTHDEVEVVDRHEVVQATVVIVDSEGTITGKGVFCQPDGDSVQTTLTSLGFTFSED